jgi:hypothetical protein
MPDGVEDEDWVDEETDVGDPAVTEGHPVTRRRRRRPGAADAAEVRLLGRRALCKAIPDIAPSILKTVKLRILGNYLESTRGLEDEQLTDVLKAQAGKLADRARVLAALDTPDPEYDRGEVRALLLAVLLEEETYGLEENRLDAKVLDYEKDLLKRSKSLDLTELRKADPDRWHHYDTYRIVLEAAWGRTARSPRTRPGSSGCSGRTWGSRGRTTG